MINGVEAEASVKTGRDRERVATYRVTLDGSDEPTVPSGLAWLQSTPQWRAVAQTRLSDANRAREFIVEVTFKDSFTLGADVAAELVKARLSLGGELTSTDHVTWRLHGTFPPAGSRPPREGD